MVLVGSRGIVRTRFGKVAGLVRHGRLVRIEGPGGDKDYYRWADCPARVAQSVLFAAHRAAQAADVSDEDAYRRRLLHAASGRLPGDPLIRPARRRKNAHGWGRLAPVGVADGGPPEGV